MFTKHSSQTKHAPDICAKDDLIRRKGPLRLAEEPATAESVTAKDPNHVDTFTSLQTHDYMTYTRDYHFNQAANSKRQASVTTGKRS
ncbi:hypothetical protein HBI92_081060 [Parastagonospora nodorum]|nr:hypothetical protein HBI90_238480 [Parastagonospora nodorum]KAH5889612.1 hypothetical protein HBI89_240890 [Parastagonospora nodorum]KAH5891757.1 hypothetical protein HBI92_081060 [Parastagonospora nodorum]